MRDPAHIERMARGSFNPPDPDAVMGDEMAALGRMLDYLASFGARVTIVVVPEREILHEMSLLCTRIGIIEAGEMVTEGSLEEIYKRLGLMQLIHVQLVNGSDALIDQIRSIPGVEEVQVQADRLAIRVRAEHLPSEELLDSMYALGARMRMFQPEAMDMETAFMKLTEGKTA